MKNISQVLFVSSLIFAIVINIHLTRKENKELKKQKIEQQDSIKRK